MLDPVGTEEGPQLFSGLWTYMYGAALHGAGGEANMWVAGRAIGGDKCEADGPTNSSSCVPSVWYAQVRGGAAAAGAEQHPEHRAVCGGGRWGVARRGGAGCPTLAGQRAHVHVGSCPAARLPLPVASSRPHCAPLPRRTLPPTQLPLIEADLYFNPRLTNQDVVYHSLLYLAFPAVSVNSNGSVLLQMAYSSNANGGEGGGTNIDNTNGDEIWEYPGETWGVGRGAPAAGGCEGRQAGRTGFRRQGQAGGG